MQELRELRATDHKAGIAIFYRNRAMPFRDPPMYFFEFRAVA
jgi:hypothetical protein